MNKQAVVYGVIGFIIGAVLTGVIVSTQMANNSDNSALPNPQTAQKHDMNAMEHTQMDMEDTSINDMNTMLEGKTGDEFDKPFISGMIIHHQGAISMAEAAKLQAGHQEIKKLADDIISAQKKEIDQMLLWQKAWGYSQ